MCYTIRKKIKSLLAFLIILILLPYIVSVFVNGKNAVKGAGKDNLSVQVKIVQENEKKEQKKENVIKIDFQRYLAGILAREIDARYGVEALKAQAVVIRTELCRTRPEDHIFTEAYLTQSQMKKKWGTRYEENYKKCQQAIDATEGMVLWYHETFAWAPFHQSSNGKTRNVQEVIGNTDYPYLVTKECPLDKAAEDEIQVHLISYEEIQQSCREFLVAEENQERAEQGYGYEDFEIQEWDSSGYVKKLRIGETVCTGDQFRDALKLPSSDFTFYESPNGLKIATVGKGHGFGMSQWTAQEMAKDGKTYEEILQYFFDGITLNQIDEKEFLNQ